MSQTIIEKILAAHCGHPVKPGDIVDVIIDARVARDFGGANVVKNLQNNALEINDPKRTFFTFDCNPGGSDQNYASNQQLCRIYAREHGIRIYDINCGIGTHLAIDRGLVGPGDTFVSTDSHANILGAIGAFGQGMGDQDIAAAWSNGSVWFKTPPTIKVTLTGQPGPLSTPKDIALAILTNTGANGFLGYAVEFYGSAVDALDLPGRITISSMNTEMGGIIGLFPPNQAVLDYCNHASGKKYKGVYADPDAVYAKEIEIDIDKLQPMMARPGHPEDVAPITEIAGRKIDSAFIGSCTNGRIEDMRAAAKILKGRKVAPGVLLKIVPSTDVVWRQCQQEGLFDIFKNADALVGNAGCAGCANGQIGQNGPGEVTVSTGNRNFAGKQGKGEVYLASPATVAASAVAGQICTADTIPDKPALFSNSPPAVKKTTTPAASRKPSVTKPTTVTGRVWVIDQDNIDTDMIYHNRYLAITDIAEMGQYTFDNLNGWKNFPQKVQPGDIVITGKNFGAGSSRQQAVDCFKSLGVSLLIAESFGAIYERNAINAGMPIMNAACTNAGLKNGDKISVDFESGKISIDRNKKAIQGQPFPNIQMDIYQRGGLLVR